MICQTKAEKDGFFHFRPGSWKPVAVKSQTRTAPSCQLPVWNEKGSWEGVDVFAREGPGSNSFSSVCSCIVLEITDIACWQEQKNTHVKHFCSYYWGYQRFVTDVLRTFQARINCRKEKNTDYVLYWQLNPTLTFLSQYMARGIWK